MVNESLKFNSFYDVDSTRALIWQDYSSIDPWTQIFSLESIKVYERQFDKADFLYLQPVYHQFSINNRNDRFCS